MRLSAIACVLGMLVSSAAWAQEAVVPPGPDRWEYMVIDERIFSKDDGLTENLNRLGKEGWELTGVLNSKNASSNRLLLKRKIEKSAFAVIALENGTLKIVEDSRMNFVIVRGPKESAAVIWDVSLQNLPELDIVVLKGRKQAVETAIKTIDKVKASKAE